MPSSYTSAWVLDVSLSADAEAFTWSFSGMLPSLLGSSIPLLLLLLPGPLAHMMSSPSGNQMENLRSGFPSSVSSSSPSAVRRWYQQVCSVMKLGPKMTSKRVMPIATRSVLCVKSSAHVLVPRSSGADVVGVSLITQELGLLLLLLLLLLLVLRLALGQVLALLMESVLHVDKRLLLVLLKPLP